MPRTSCVALPVGKPRAWRRRGAAALLLSACVCLSGCDLIAAVAGVAGPAAIPAKYKLPQKPTLILVEGEQPTSLQAEGTAVGQAVYAVLKAGKTALLVEPTVLERLRGSDPAKYAAMSIVDIGRATGAAQIIYVKLEQCELTDIAGSDAYQGIIKAQVHVVDVATGGTPWPADAMPYAIHRETPFSAPDATARPAVERDMIEQTGLQIARLFMEYKPEYEDADSTEREN